MLSWPKQRISYTFSVFSTFNCVEDTSLLRMKFAGSKVSSRKCMYTVHVHTSAVLYKQLHINLYNSVANFENIPVTEAH